MQLNSRRRRDRGVSAHSPHDVILVTLDNPNHNTRPANRIADVRRYQSSSIATRMLVNTDSARTSHSAATHLGEQGIPLQLIMAKTRHRNPRTAMRYVRPGAEAVAEITALLEPPRRRG
jgi:hypothetical protein